MTLTELRYLVTLARERHFGRAAEACHVSQPTLSVAIRKLEESLGMTLFERHRHGVLVTPAGEALIAQAQVVLKEVAQLEAMAGAARDEFSEPLRLGAIFTVGPYLFPALVRHLRQQASPLRLYLEENYTHVLNERLLRGELDAILLAAPCDAPETRVTPLYDEAFHLLLPDGHPLLARSRISSRQLREQPVLMLGEGHCFRDQVLERCEVGSAPGMSPGSSLMTLRHMVASGLGLTLIPASAEPMLLDDTVACRPLVGDPGRRIVLASRYRFPRQRALQALTEALQVLALPGTTPCR